MLVSAGAFVVFVGFNLLALSRWADLDCRCVFCCGLALFGDLAALAFARTAPNAVVDTVFDGVFEALFGNWA